MKTIKRRRKENKTDYSKRLELLKGGYPRIVFRRTNKYVIAQYVTNKEAKDKIEIGLSSKKLLSYGWPEKSKGSLKSIPASYFLGWLMGKEIKKKGLKKPILDFGLQRVLEKTRTQAFINGLVDSGLDIGHKTEAFPNKERIHGKHIKDFNFETIKLKIEGK